MMNFFHNARFGRNAKGCFGISNLLFLFSVFICAELSAQAQGTFQNLGFESAVLVPIPGDPYGRVQFAPAFPGWTGYIGGVQQTEALYDSAFLDSSGIGILDQGADQSPNPLIHGRVIQGTYTAILQAGWALGMFTPADTTLSQTGVVPPSTTSLRFRGSLDPVSASFGVFLGGQALSLLPLGGGSNYTLYGADIQSFAGQTAQLDFTVFAQRPHQLTYTVFLDSIQFSSQPIPEPSSFCLSALAALFLCRRFAHQR